MNPILELRARVGLTQAELASAGHTSQPAIAAYESGAKSPTFRTLQRLSLAVSVELHVVYTPPMTREERRSLELHRAIASKLSGDAELVIGRARRNLEKMGEVNPGAATLLDAWDRLLDLPVNDLIDLLIDPRPRARELRHVTPFAGVLTPVERWNVYRQFHKADAG